MPVNLCGSRKSSAVTAFLGKERGKTISNGTIELAQDVVSIIETTEQMTGLTLSGPPSGWRQTRPRSVITDETRYEAGMGKLDRVG